MRITGPIPDNILRLMPKEMRPLGKAGFTKEEIEALNDKKTEKNIHDDIESFLRRNSIPYDHSRMDRKTTNKVGDPDFKIYMFNHVLFLEIKKPGGKLSEEQKKRITELEHRGNTVEVCYSYDQAKAAIFKFFPTSQYMTRTIE